MEEDPEIPNFEPVDPGDDDGDDDKELIEMTSVSSNNDTDERTPLLSEQSDNRREALQFIKRIFPDFKPLESSFTAEWDKDGNVKVKLSTQSNAKEHTLIDKDGVINYDNLPKTILKDLGADYETMLGRNDEIKSQLEKQMKRIKN